MYTNNTNYTIPTIAHYVLLRSISVNYKNDEAWFLGFEEWNIKKSSSSDDRLAHLLVQA